MSDYLTEKRRLRDFLSRSGIHVTDKKPPTLRCPNPGHLDENPSAILYDNPDVPMVYCPVCAASWSVFEVAGLMHHIPSDKKYFPEKLKIVREVLNMSDQETTPIPEVKKIKPPKKKTPPVSLPIDKARTFYNTTDIMARCLRAGWGDRITGSWSYTDENGDIIALDVRFEGGQRKKEVITFWYDGKHLKSADSPFLIYNLHVALTTEKPILIVEGAKCATAAGVLTAFTPVSWCGGTGKAGHVDWSVFEGREVYAIPDDDEPLSEKPGVESRPGMKAVLEIKKQLPQLKIIELPEHARIKPKGSDIEEWLTVNTPDEITDMIFSGGVPRASVPESEPDDEQEPGTTTQETPYTPLGIGSDNKAYFLTEAGRLESYTLESISKGKLMVLAGRWWWKNNYGDRKNGVSWDDAIDDIIRECQNRDFDPSSIRGRGAWRDGDKISYHDGVKTYGEWDSSKKYERLPRARVGIDSEPLDEPTVRKIKDTIFKLSFETPSDAVRALGWSVLAPFAGALKHRPAMLLTGPSGSGKSTVATMILKRVSNCLWLNGSESTVAGVRGLVKRDSTSVLFEETERDTERKKINRDELFSLMRVNVTDDAPDTVKGTKDGGYNSFKMQNMFGFIAIDPTIESVADENRIFRVNMVPPKNQGDWKSIDADLHEHLTSENCDRLRALAWTNLKNIFTLSDRIVDIIRHKTARDYRSSFADALLAAAYMVVWTCTANPTDEQIEKMLTKYYSYQPADEHRDESTEVVDRLMDEIVEVIHDDHREKISLMECMTRIFRGETCNDDGTVEPLTGKAVSTYRNHAARYGLRVVDGDKIALVNQHHLIQKITGLGTGYGKILKRHPGYVDGSKVVHFPDGKGRRCTILKNIIVKRHSEMTNDEKLSLVMFGDV